MLVTLVLVVGVIFLFLHNGSATLIPALALPFSILGTFAVMQVLDFSLNNLSMMALILSIGFVVDDAIVMLENIVRHIENGEAPLEAALEGIEGDRLHDPDDDHVARRRVHPDPVHGRHPRPAVPRVRGHDHDGDSHLGRRVGHADADAVQPVPARRAQQEGLRRPDGSRVRPACSHGYEWSLALVLRHRLVMLGVFAVVLAATVHMFHIVPKGFIPDQDNDSLFVNLQAAQGTSYYDMAEVGAAGRRHRHQEPVRRLVHGQRRRRRRRRRREQRRSLMVQLSRARRATVTAQQIAQQLRPQLLRFPGFRGVREPAAVAADRRPHAATATTAS